MVREFSITIYLDIFSFFFNLFKLFPVKNKIVFCISFVENTAYIYEELKKRNVTARIVLINENNACFSYFRQKCDQDSVLLLRPKKLYSFLSSIYHLATAKVIILDNYFGFLSAIQFKEKVKKVQIWHAAGAIKQFGLMDPSIMNRSKRANRRFHLVYKQFDYFIVGSKKMENIFIEAFGVNSSQFIYSGIPRTDIFFDESKKSEIVQNLKSTYPLMKDKKVILYAPTFRDGELNNYHLPIDLSYLQKKLGDSYVLILKLHPAIKNYIDLEKYQHFTLNLSNYPRINDLLFITDYLITDYSSIPFEFSFLHKPMIFFPYDLENYLSTRGIWESYESMVPGPVVYSTEAIVNVIKSNSFDRKRIATFHQSWNEFSLGYSSSNLVTVIEEWIKSY